MTGKCVEAAALLKPKRAPFTSDRPLLLLGSEARPVCTDGNPRHGDRSDPDAAGSPHRTMVHYGGDARRVAKERIQTPASWRD